MLSLGSPLISIALVLTYKSIYVHKNAENNDFCCPGTLDTCMEISAKGIKSNSASVLTVPVQF